MRTQVNYFTTGQVAVRLSTSARTVAEMCDRGTIPCVRVPPPAGPRRIHREDLLEFCRQQGMHREVAELESSLDTVLSYGMSCMWNRQLRLGLGASYQLLESQELFDLGWQSARYRILAVILPAQQGMLWLMGKMRKLDDRLLLLGILPEDQLETPFLSSIFPHLYKQPVDPVMVANTILMRACNPCVSTSTR